MLYEFVDVYREDIVARARDRARNRSWPSVSSQELEHGVPLFLTQLSDILRRQTTAHPLSNDALCATASRYGAALSAVGLNVSQVVHLYGDICHALTEIAVERRASITVAEFHTLNRCLDTAIAEAVTEHARLTAQRQSDEEVQRLGQVTHELRNFLNSALLALDALKRGTVAVNGRAGAVLGRSLTGIQALVGGMLSEVRLSAGRQRHERLSVARFVEDIAATGTLHSECRGVRLAVMPIDPAWAVDGDPHLLASAVMNLLHNAFRHTPASGVVVLRARAQDDRLLIDIEDECGGIPANKGDLFRPFGNGHDADRSGLGLGLSIARLAARAHGGDIHVHNKPGHGCVFTMDMPLAADLVSASPSR